MIDNFLKVVLRRKFEAVIRDMVNALFKSGRSGVLNTAMDFSCAVTDAKFQSVSVALCLPLHVGAIELIPQAVAAKHGATLKAGDCFANNDSYLGNTHCADFTLCVPVFHTGKLRFYAIARAHFADMGFAVPTTYHPTAKDVYEEGLTFPCVRIQKNYEDIEEVIDICKANIRVPDQFYGDYLACIGAVRTGERRLGELCDEYGAEVIEEFCDEFQDYAEKIAHEAISRLPKGKATKTAYYDSDLPEYPNGIPTTATLEVDPDQGIISFDLTENVDNVPLGINLSESTTVAAFRIGALNILGPDVPRCTGAFRRIKIKMREGAIIGKPKFPAATCCATSNIAHMAGGLAHSLFADISDSHGAAFASIGQPGSCPVISGVDPRQDNKPFVNQMLLGYFGGPGVAGAESWLTFHSYSSQGMAWQPSVELCEQQQPVIVEELGIRVDSGGAGEFQGGPGSKVIFHAHSTPLRLHVTGGAHDNPPPGVRGGKAGAPSRIWKQDLSGKLTDLGIAVDVTLQKGERLISESCGGGGYGDPAARNKEKVAADLREGWISPEQARKYYDVKIGA